MSGLKSYFGRSKSEKVFSLLVKFNGFLQSLWFPPQSQNCCNLACQKSVEFSRYLGFLLGTNCIDMLNLDWDIKHHYSYRAVFISKDFKRDLQTLLMEAEESIQCTQVMKRTGMLMFFLCNFQSLVKLGPDQVTCKSCIPGFTGSSPFNQWGRSQCEQLSICLSNVWFVSGLVFSIYQN